MTLTLSCPHAEYREEMRIYCKVAGGPCAHQHFKSCKGWWVLTDQADACPAREEGFTYDHKGSRTAADTQYQHKV